MASITSDISKDIDITARRNDSFFIEIVVANDDGSVYDLIKTDESTFDAQLTVYNTNNQPILGFSSKSESAGYFIDNSITVTGSTATIKIEAAGSAFNIMKSTYKYKLVVTGDTEVNTLMSGKFKVIDL